MGTAVFEIYQMICLQNERPPLNTINNLPAAVSTLNNNLDVDTVSKLHTNCFFYFKIKLDEKKNH